MTPGPTQYLFSGDGNGKIYKLDLNGNLLGWAQTGLGHGQSRLPRARAALRIGERDLQGRLLDLDGREDHHQGRARASARDYS